MSAPTARSVAADRWPGVDIIGAGRYAVSHCNGAVTLATTPAAADAVRARFNRFGCGGTCGRHHDVLDLKEPTS